MLSYVFVSELLKRCLVVVPEHRKILDKRPFNGVNGETRLRRSKKYRAASSSSYEKPVNMPMCEKTSVLNFCT